MKLRHLLIVATALAAGCATGPRVTTDADPAANFSGYRTYSWVVSSPPQGMNPIMYERIKASIDRSLAARAFTQGEPADFAIAFTVGARDRVEVTDYGPYATYYPGWGRGYRYGWAPVYNNVDVRNVTDGTLAIDIYDAGTRRPVWHGVATKEIRPERIEQADIDEAIDAVLDRFPPQ